MVNVNTIERPQTNAATANIDSNDDPLSVEIYRMEKLSELRHTLGRLAADYCEPINQTDPTLAQRIHDAFGITDERVPLDQRKIDYLEWLTEFIRINSATPEAHQAVLRRLKPVGYRLDEDFLREATKIPNAGEAANCLNTAWQGEPLEKVLIKKELAGGASGILKSSNQLGSPNSGPVVILAYCEEHDRAGNKIIRPVCNRYDVPLYTELLPQ